MTAYTPPDTLERLQREDLAQRHVKNAENWLRKLIHHQLSDQLGINYISQGPWKGELIKRVNEILAARGCAREVDATTFEQAVYLSCHPTHWEHLFAPALSSAYPLGREEAREFLNRIKDIRNDLAHNRGCTSRQLERAICYSNDLAQSIMEFFRGLNMERDYNVPLIVKFEDNRGNLNNLENVSLDIHMRIIDFRRSGNGDLRPGDNLVAQVDIDPAFQQESYDVFWHILGEPRVEGKVANVSLERRHVSEQIEIRFYVITKKDWHRQNGLDDMLSVLYRVLPPLE